MEPDLIFADNINKRGQPSCPLLVIKKGHHQVAMDVLNESFDEFPHTNEKGLRS
jgi:hypothetical protein